MEGLVTITGLTQSAKSTDRFYAEFDNGEGFTVTIGHIADFSLYTGRTLKMEEYRDLSIAAERSKARSMAMRMLGNRPMSKGEIAEKLEGKGFRAEVSQEAALWLEEIGAVDEEDYAAMIVRHYAGRGYGLQKIKNELFKRRIPKELWEEAISQMPETDEEIDRLLSSRFRNREIDDKEIKKASDMLLRRGFSYEEVRSALRRLRENIED